MYRCSDNESPLLIVSAAPDSALAKIAQPDQAGRKAADARLRADAGSSAESLACGARLGASVLRRCAADWVDLMALKAASALGSQLYAYDCWPAKLLGVHWGLTTVLPLDSSCSYNSLSFELTRGREMLQNSIGHSLLHPPHADIIDVTYSLSLMTSGQSKATLLAMSNDDCICF